MVSRQGRVLCGCGKRRAGLEGARVGRGSKPSPLGSETERRSRGGRVTVPSRMVTFSVMHNARVLAGAAYAPESVRGSQTRRRAGVVSRLLEALSAKTPPTGRIFAKGAGTGCVRGGNWVSRVRGTSTMRSGGSGRGGVLGEVSKT